MRIALFEPDIPQNTGNILRLGACLGIPIDIIEPTGYIFDDKRLQRSLMDYVKYINYKRHIDWDAYVKWSNKNKYRIILLTTKSRKAYTTFKFSKSDALLFGRESAGVPDYVHEKAYERLLIPLKQNRRSLNVSTAVAMVTGEALRQIT